MDGVYTGVAGLRLEGYGFLLNLSAPGYAVLPVQQTATAKLSTQTYGLRADYSFALPDSVGAKLTGGVRRSDQLCVQPAVLRPQLLPGRSQRHLPGNQGPGRL